MFACKIVIKKSGYSAADSGGRGSWGPVTPFLGFFSYKTKFRSKKLVLIKRIRNLSQDVENGYVTCSKQDIHKMQVVSFHVPISFSFLPCSDVF